MTSSDLYKYWTKKLSRMTLSDLKYQVILDGIMLPSSVEVVRQQDEKMAKMTIDELSDRILLGD